MGTIDNTDDLIDSREVIARIEELTDERDAAIDAGEDFDEDSAKELAALEALASEAEGYCSDWKYGETLIRDSYFRDYAMQLAEDIGAMKDNAQWPHTCIDWDQAARELQMDYTAVEFDGVTYWTR